MLLAMIIVIGRVIDMVVVVQANGWLCIYALVCMFGNILLVEQTTLKWVEIFKARIAKSKKIVERINSKKGLAKA